MNHELLSIAEMYQADKMATEVGVPSLSLMEAAGEAVARLIRQCWTPRPIVVLCGPGNNGGDGFVIARILSTRGWPVKLALLGNKEALVGDALINAMRWKHPILTMDPKVLDGSALVVDALFGAGLTRSVKGRAAAVIKEINIRKLQCIGVDIPSGVHGDTGEVLGIAPQCVATVTFFRPKFGHFLYPGANLKGKLHIADIGIPKSLLTKIAPKVSVNTPILWHNHFPWPDSNSHKYTRGHLLILGSEIMTGAAQLAARGGRRIGAGLVSIAAPDNAGNIYKMTDPGQIVRSINSPKDFSKLLCDERYNTLLLGPGAGVTAKTRQCVLAALKTNRPIVLDADALTVFAAERETLFEALHEKCVLTPHEGEFARLFHIKGNKLTRTRKAAQQAGCIVLLKGADTVIATPDGRAVIALNAPPELSTGGSGDVLSGLIAGLLAQGMTIFAATCVSVWIHAKAANQIGPGLIAEDLPNIVPKILRTLKKLV